MDAATLEATVEPLPTPSATGARTLVMRPLEAIVLESVPGVG